MARFSGRSIALFFTILLMGACSIAPEKMDASEHQARAIADFNTLKHLQPQATAPISLYEAMARALKYNFNDRLALMEAALQRRQLDLVKTDLLPKIVADAGYTIRNNERASSSISVKTRRQSLEPSVSEDKQVATANLGLTWNILDFGVSYFQAKQQANRVLLAEERRQRVANNVIMEVQEAFLNAAVAQELLAQLDPLLVETSETLALSRQSALELLAPPLETLRDQKILLETTRQLRALRNELLQSKSTLGALMSLPPSALFTMIVPTETDMTLYPVLFDMEKLEYHALVHRTELREEDYQSRIAQQEVRKAMLRMLPGLSLSADLKADSNSFLLNSIWAEAGSQVTWNLMQLISGPKAIAAAKTQRDVARARRLALSMAVLTQVHLAALEYQRSLLDIEQATALDRIEAEILALTRNAEVNEAQSGMDRIRVEISALASTLSRRRTIIRGHTAFATLRTSIGVNFLPEEVQDASLDTLTIALRRKMKTTLLEDLQTMPIPQTPRPPKFDEPVTFMGTLTRILQLD